jgi:hypothetical protein
MSCAESYESSMSAEDLPDTSSPRWLRGCAVAAALLLVMAVTTCSVGSAGIRRGLIAPPWIVRHFGPVHLIAIQTLTPECALEFPCGQPLNIRDPLLKRYYVVYLVISWPGPERDSLSRYRLFMQKLE